MPLPRVFLEICTTTGVWQAASIPESLCFPSQERDPGEIDLERYGSRDLESILGFSSPRGAVRVKGALRGSLPITVSSDISESFDLAEGPQRIGCTTLQNFYQYSWATIPALYPNSPDSKSSALEECACFYALVTAVVQIHGDPEARLVYWVEP